MDQYPNESSALPGAPHSKLVVARRDRQKQIIAATVQQARGLKTMTDPGIAF